MVLIGTRLDVPTNFHFSSSNTLIDRQSWQTQPHLNRRRRYGEVSLANWIYNSFDQILAVIAPLSRYNGRRWFFVHKDIDRIITRSPSRKKTHSNEFDGRRNRIMFFWLCMRVLLAESDAFWLLLFFDNAAQAPPPLRHWLSCPSVIFCP